jgi:hypothetical protein
MASRTAALSSSVPCPAQQQQGDRRLGGCRRLTPQALLLEELLDPLKKEFNVPSGLIQTEDLSITPVLVWQGCHHQDPSREIEGRGLHVLLLLARFALGPSLGLLLLVLAETKSDQPQLDALVQIGNPNRATTDPSVGAMESIRPTPPPRSTLHARLAWETWRG